MAFELVHKGKTGQTGNCADIHKTGVNSQKLSCQNNRKSNAVGTFATKTIRG